MAASTPLPTFDDVRAAAERLRGRVVRTPTLRLRPLERPGGPELWAKCENLQHVRAFKARGAQHAAARLAPEVRARGLVTYSSGNHAQAVALAARAFGVPATVAMPVDAPEVKVAAVRALGARIVPAGTTSDDRRRVAQDLAHETGAALVEPFDHPDIVTGQGTATLELCEDVAREAGAPPDLLLVPVGGGGLIAGACLVAGHHTIPVCSVEPSTCDAMARSLEQGARVAVTPGPTLADGLRPTRVGALNFALARAHGVRPIRVEDEAIARALVALLLRVGLLVEPSGAAALAAALEGDLPGTPGRLGVLLSGGNVAPALVADLLARYGAGP